LGIYVLAGSLAGGTYFSYFPSLKWADASFFGMSIFAAYMLLCVFPIIVEIREVRKWKALSSKI